MTNPTIAQAVTDEQAEALFAVLVSLGSEPEDVYGFQHHVKNPESYWGGVFEWTDRLNGVRMLINKFPHAEQARSATVYDHGFCRFSEQDFADANARLAEAFAK